MIIGSLTKYMNEINYFNQLSDCKIYLREEKYKNDISLTQDIKRHLIDEIIECFQIEDNNEIKTIRKILMNTQIKNDELIDISNMCKALYISINNDDNSK